MTTWAADLVNGTDTQVAPAQVAAVVPTVYSKANPCQITSNGHGLLNGDYIYIIGVTGTGWTVVNGYWTITYVDANNFTIPVSTAGATGATPTVFGTWITAINKTNPCAVTLKAHGFSAGQLIYITGVVGMTQLNAIAFKVGTVTNANNFTLQTTAGVDINATGYTAYTSGGTYTTYSKIITGITKANPAVVTCSAHGLSNTNKVYLDVQGMTQLHKFIGTVANATTDTFELSGVDSSAFSDFTSGTARRPYLNLNTINAIPALIGNDGDEVYVAQTWKDDSSVDVGSGNITFTEGSATITTSVSLVGTIAAGDFIGKTSAVGTGWDGVSARPEVFYKVNTIAAGSITLFNKYAGASGTVSSISRLRQNTEIVNTGSASSVAVTWSRNSCIVEGGYDFSGGTITRNGETWFKQVTLNNATLNISGITNTFKYFGVIGNHQGASTNNTGTNNVVEYCYFHNAQRDAITTTNSITRYCSSTQYNASYVCFVNAAGGLTRYCYGNGGRPSSTAGGFRNDSNTGVFENCLAEYGYNGFMYPNTTTFGSVINCAATNCTYGCSLYSSGFIKGGTFTSCTGGILMNSDGRGNIVRDCTFNTCTIGAYLSRHGSSVMENCSYNSCGRDVFLELSPSNVKIFGHVSTTPTTWALDLTQAVSIHISNFSIDAPSIAKSFSALPSIISYSCPSYTLQGCPQFPDGAYYGTGSYIKETTNYRTSSPAMKLQLNATYTSNYGDIKIYSLYAKAGVARTITFYMKRHASWVGTIIPYFKLNGQIVETETSITSINDADWQQFVLTCSAGSITVDGELSLEFNVNATANPIYLDDFTVS